MENLSITRAENKIQAAQLACQRLNKLLAENKKNPILLMLSGGSAFNILVYINPEVLGENVTITMLDERFSQDEKVTNFGQLQKTQFYMDAFEKECSFLGSVPRPKESLKAFTERRESSLRKWHEENPKGKIIATVGIGPDGHTAGIFPFPESPETFKFLFQGPNWVLGYDASEKNEFKERVTITITFFKMIDEAIIYMTGEEKKPALDKLISKADDIQNLPALAIYEIKNVTIFTDIA